MTAPGAMLTGRYSAPGAVRALRLRASEIQFPACAGEGAGPTGVAQTKKGASALVSACHPERGGGFRRGRYRRAFLSITAGAYLPWAQDDGQGYHAGAGIGCAPGGCVRGALRTRHPKRPKSSLFPPRPRQSPIVAGQQIQHRPAGSSPRRGRQAGARAALPGRPTARAPGASRPYHRTERVASDVSPAHVASLPNNRRSPVPAKTRLSDPRAEVAPSVDVKRRQRGSRSVGKTHREFGEEVHERSV